MSKNNLTHLSSFNMAEEEEQRDIERAVAASLDLPPAYVHDYASLIRHHHVQMMEEAPTDGIFSSSQRQETNAGWIRADLAARNYYIGEEDGDNAKEEIQIKMTNKTDAIPSARHLRRETIDDRIREMVDGRAKKKDNSPSSSQDQPPQRVTIDDRIEHMSAIFASELAQTNVKNGDTWVFIDPPAFAPPEQDEKTFNRYVARLKNPMVVSSHRLKALNSTFFDHCLSPTVQYRTLRRRELVYKLPSYIKYVVDLTPPSEGDSAAFLMTELCCPEGVRTWSESRWRWSVSPTLVAGIDEFTGPLPLQEPEIREMHQKTPEYSALRHRSSIERVLNVIHDIDPLLDSAPKVWTTFVVAKYFEITHSPLTDYIVRWLRAYPNSLFIEVMPEITLRIADGIQCQELIRDTFAILVGEEALEGIRSPNAKYTAYGRRKYDVPEPYKTRIEYASKSFLDRICGTYRMLTAEDMEWIEELPEFQKLTKYASDRVVAELMRKLKAFVRGNIWVVSYLDYLDLEDTPVRLIGMPEHEMLFPVLSPTQFWDKQQPHERRRTYTFWNALKHSKLLWSNSIHDLRAGRRDIQTSQKPKQLWDVARNHGIEAVHLEELATLDRLVQQSTLPGQHQFQLPIRHKVQHNANNVEFEFFGNLPTDKPQDQGREREKRRFLGDFEFFENPTEGQNVDPLPASSSVSSNNLRLSHEIPWHARPFEPSSADSHKSLVDDSLWFRHPDRFCLPEFKVQVKRYIEDVCDSILCSRDPERASPMELNLTLTLVGLKDSEWKYLPLYAGGLDDGSGGVFDDEVPLAETGFSTAGPAIHTGVGSSAASSEFDFVRSRDGDSSYNTSTVVNDGFSDALGRGRVYAADEVLLDDPVATDEHPTASAMGDVETESTTSSVLTPTGAGVDRVTASVREADTIKQEEVKEMADEEEDNYEDIFSYEADDEPHEEDEDDLMTEVEDLSDDKTHEGHLDFDSDSDMVIL
ncbi:MAG: hypothetical protein LQ342_004964 [Letrouitia transgressa]|nr:MAG: hypothetical protein LQ342_004964 [Letrouitia transgressa]